MFLARARAKALRQDSESRSRIRYGIHFVQSSRFSDEHCIKNCYGLWVMEQTSMTAVRKTKDERNVSRKLKSKHQRHVPRQRVPGGSGHIPKA